jgi:hypothetical protein
MQSETIHRHSEQTSRSTIKCSAELGRCGGLHTLFAAGAVLAILILPAMARGAECVGDCSDNGEVLVNELITGVNIALGTASVDSCPVFDENQDGDVVVNELIKAVKYALEGCPPAGEGLGERVFSVRTDTAVFSESRSMLGNEFVAGANVAMGFSAGPLVLVAGEPGVDGMATLVLAQDAIVGVLTADTTVACYKFLAEGSTGSIDCDGGPAPDIIITQDTGQNAPPAEITIQDGSPTGPGAAVLEVMVASGSLAAGATVADCLSASFGTPAPNALTTATGTGNKGDKTLSLAGENFSCDQWTTENGPGMLVMPQPSYDMRAGGDTVVILRLADQ